MTPGRLRAYRQLLLARFRLTVVMAAIVGMKLADAVRSERTEQSAFPLRAP
jgi:hypothetical protein